MFWGAISSSGVTAAIEDYWQYWEPIRLYGPQDCIHASQQFVQVIDGIFIDHKDDHDLAHELKTVFNLQNLTHNDDAARMITISGVGSWQGRVWDPAVTSNAFSKYCSKVSDSSSVYSHAGGLADTMKKLIIASGRIQDVSNTFVNQMLNLVGWVNATIVTPCAKRGETQDMCFTSRNESLYDLTDRSQIWRSWAWQVCTQWGYHQTGSGAPPDVLPLISRTVDLEWCKEGCRSVFNLSGTPDVDSINKYGSFDIYADRLAIIDGQADPWVYATPHAPQAPRRKDTLERPFREIANAVHHWDEYGLLPNETTKDLPPKRVKEIQAYEIRFVKQWMKEYYGQGFGQTVFN